MKNKAVNPHNDFPALLIFIWILKYLFLAIQSKPYIDSKIQNIIDKLIIRYLLAKQTTRITTFPHLTETFLLNIQQTLSHPHASVLYLKKTYF